MKFWKRWATYRKEWCKKSLSVERADGEKCSRKQWWNVKEGIKIKIPTNTQNIPHLDPVSSFLFVWSAVGTNGLQLFQLVPSERGLFMLSNIWAVYLFICPGFFLCHEILVQDETEKRWCSNRMINEFHHSKRLGCPHILGNRNRFTNISAQKHILL